MGMQIASPLTPEAEELIRSVIGAAIEVHRHLGPGFLEGVYEQALCREFELRSINYEKQKEIAIPYKGIVLTGQRLDILVEQQLILELKAVAALLPIHDAQIISYLRATNMRAGLLINFNVKILRQGIKRIIV